jgi:hypothetical protein
VTLTPESVQLPYRIRSLPPHYEVTRSPEADEQLNRGVLARNDYPEGIIQISVRYPAGLPMYAVNNSASVLRYAMADTLPSAGLSGTATSVCEAISAVLVPSTSLRSVAP